MVRGLFVFGWDKKLGAVIDLKHPQNLEISDDLINKIYITHTYHDENKKEDLVEISTEDVIFLSYCDKSRIPDVGYEVVSVMLDEKEKRYIKKIKEDFISFSQKLLTIEKEGRKKQFYDNLDVFFPKSTAKKILLLGRAGSGKTSIKKIIFEGKDPKKLLFSPLNPTRGISPNAYSWLDLKLGIFDSSGQELSYLLEHEEDDDFNLAFEDTDIIVYVMDYTLWHTKRNEVDLDIQKIFQIIENRDLKAKLVIFVHKIDLIDKQEYNNVIEEMKVHFHKNPNTKIFFTSIHPEWIYNLYNAFYDILSSSSNETLNLMAVLKERLTDTSKTMSFVTNLKDSIIVQSMTNDFNTNIINRSHKFVADLNQNFEEMSQDGRIDHLILSSEDNFNIIMNNLNMTKFGLKYIIIISENLTANKLILLVGQIRLRLKDYYYLNKKRANYE